MLTRMDRTERPEDRKGWAEIDLRSLVFGIWSLIFNFAFTTKKRLGELRIISGLRQPELRRLRWLSSGTFFFLSYYFVLSKSRKLLFLWKKFEGIWGSLLYCKKTISAAATSDERSAPVFWLRQKILIESKSIENGVARIQNSSLHSARSCEMKSQILDSGKPYRKCKKAVYLIHFLFSCFIIPPVSLQVFCSILYWFLASFFDFGASLFRRISAYLFFFRWLLSR